jgi:hypothetical protein
MIHRWIGKWVKTGRSSGKTRGIRPALTRPAWRGRTNKSKKTVYAESEQRGIAGMYIEVITGFSSSPGLSLPEISGPQKELTCG